MYRPKVGEECEYSLCKSVIWFKCTVKYIVGDHGYVLDIPNIGGEYYASVNGIDKVEFRPLKSKRDEYCCEVYDILKNSQSIPECCERLYDAGYRKKMPYDDFINTIRSCLVNWQLATEGSSISIAADIAYKLGRHPTEEN
jgi:hypothetical protein